MPAKSKKQKNLMKIKLCQNFLRIVYPTFSIVFIVIFWVVGMIKYAEN